MTEKSDVLVIGAGPAGSTISHLLSKLGRRVVVLEMAHHPRFHIGESLLPMNMPILERLGLLGAVREIGVVKNAAEFNPPDPNHRRATFYFDRAMDPTIPSALQVKRAEFDHILLKASRAAGSEVHEGVRVTDVEFHPGAPALVTAIDEQGETRRWEARFVVDASGRDTVLARKFGTKEKNPRHHSAAVFAHFSKVERRTGRDEGNISVYWFDYGWMWMIPLRGGAMSVGAVCWPEYLKTRNAPLNEFLMQTIALCPAIAQRMEKAEMTSETIATGNYSYRSRRMYGDGYLMIGDAFTFLDPVFSSGVLLAMNSAEAGAEAVDAYLTRPAAGLAAMKKMERRVDRGLKVFTWFIYRFTSPVMRALFLRPGKNPAIERAVTSVLAGDIFGGSRIGPGVLGFKAWYYIFCLFMFSSQWPAYWRRKRNVVEKFNQGTLPQDRPEVVTW